MHVPSALCCWFELRRPGRANISRSNPGSWINRLPDESRAAPLLVIDDEA